MWDKTVYVHVSAVLVFGPVQFKLFPLVVNGTLPVNWSAIFQQTGNIRHFVDFVKKQKLINLTENAVVLMYILCLYVNNPYFQGLRLQTLGELQVNTLK